MRAAPLDRISPTRPPEGRSPSGHQGWRQLLFAHWSYAPELVRALVPAELELDLWDGKAWVGVVPFEMRDIRLAHMPKLLGLDFLETNLRTYVHYKGEPGVYFFSLEASSRLAVRAARLGWGLPYFKARMSAALGATPIRYESTRAGAPDARLVAEYEIGPALGLSEPGTFEHFLLERYYLFAEKRGQIKKGHVHHVPYPAHSVTLTRMECGLLEAAGLPSPNRPPDVAHYSPGVDVDVYGPWDV